MKKRSVLFFLLIPLLLAACQPQRAPESTRLPDASTTPAAATPVAAEATSALVILAQRSATPYQFPSPVVRAAICDGAPKTNIIVHERARVTNDDPQPLNVRETPGTNGRILEQLESLDIFMVIDGPRCANNFTWYRIRVGDTEGWVAEGDDAMYYIEPYTP